MSFIYFSHLQFPRKFSTAKIITFFFKRRIYSKLFSGFNVEILVLNITSFQLDYYLKYLNKKKLSRLN